MYRTLRPLLFLLPPEMAHKVSLTGLKILHKLGLSRLFFGRAKNNPVECFGLQFKNPVGIAAGLDKNGDYIDCLASLGVGFIEVGGVTPKPQLGNPKPRLHRLIKQNALINWMGLNNKGIDYLVDNLKNCQHKCLIAVNLARNKTTPNERAEDDYIHSLTKVFPYADFIVINISCPNSNNIEAQQNDQHLPRMLTKVIAKRDELQQRFCKKMPLLVKVSPDLADEQLKYLLTIAQQTHVDGIVAANASTSRIGVEQSEQAKLKGGLSGAPLTANSLSMLQTIKQHTPELPVISVGGIMTGEEAMQRFNNGAALVQLYTGLIYRGPELIKNSVTQ